jgi:hypothetical protein
MVMIIKQIENCWGAIFHSATFTNKKTQTQPVVNFTYFGKVFSLS